MNLNNQYDANLGAQGVPLQGQVINSGLGQVINPGVEQIILNQSVPGQVYNQAPLLNQGLQSGFVPHHQGVPGVTLNREEYAVQSVLQGAGASFHVGSNLGPATGINQAGGFGAGGLGTGLGTGLNSGLVGQPGYGTGLNSGLVGQPGYGTGLGTGVGTGLGTGLATGAAVGTGALAGNALAGNLDPSVKGTFMFRPLEGKFYKDQDVIGKMDPYCKIKLGHHKGKTAVAKSEGVNPVWADVITLQKKHKEEFAKLKVKDHDKLRLNDRIGEAKIPLGEIIARGVVNQWYPVFKKDKQTGEVLMENSFHPVV